MSKRPRVALFVLMAGLAACAAGSDADGTTSSTGGGVAWTTSTGGTSEGGAPSQGGSGGAPTTTSAGGDGGSSTDGGSSAGGQSSDGGGGAGTGGAGPEGQAVLVAIGPNGGLGAHYEPSNGWATQSLTGSMTERPTIAARGEDDAIALFRNGAALSFSTFDGSAWSTPAAVGPSVTTRATPSVTADAASAYVVFHGDDFKHYFAVYTSSFNPTGELVGNPQSFGPAPASIALDGANAVIAFTGNDGDLYDQTRSAGTWSAAHPHALTGVTSTPALVALDQGADLLVVFARTSTTVSYSTSSGGVWSSAADLPDTFTQDPISVAALPGGKAVASFRGTNGKVYATTYDPGAAPVWSTPIALDAGAALTPSTPSVAAGLGGAEAELAYVASGSGSVMHARLISGAWSTPTAVGGSGLTAVSITARP